MNKLHLTNRARMISCAVLLGTCFAIGYPALFEDRRVVWGVCCLLSLPLSFLVGHYHRAARGRA